MKNPRKNVVFSKLDRRLFLCGGGGLLSTLATGASAQQIIKTILATPQRGKWDDEFDARSPGTGHIVTNHPVMSLVTIAYIQNAIEQYNNILARGGWPMVPAQVKLQFGSVDPAVSILRKRLMVSGDLPQSAGLSQSYDTYVDAAVKRFQVRHGLPDDGTLDQFTVAAMNISAVTRLGQLQTNLRRVNEEVANVSAPRFVMVNIPAARIEAVENGRVAQHHTAIVGKIDRQTPILNSRIHEIILNPYWTAPKSIIQKDIIPLMRKDPTYLLRAQIKLFNRRGIEVQPESVDWDTDEAVNLMFRQQPGKNNAMSSTKINFSNPYSVYMHDTPLRSMFNKLMRFDSSGCVRVQNIRDLDVWLLKNTAGWSRQAIEDRIKSGINTPIRISDPVPLHFVYITAWSSRDGVVQFRDDIYRRDGMAELALSTST